MDQCYRHTDDMIERLEHAGLGYHVQAKDTKDRLGEACVKYNIVCTGL
jgi:hypothetical protein